MSSFARAFAGGMEIPEKFGTWRAPNITPHNGSGIGAWTDDQIVTAIRQGLRPDGGPLYPIMPSIGPIKNKVAKSTLKPRAMGAPPGAAAGSADKK